MDILHATGRKRETYQIQLKYGTLWECALGIAAITNTPIIHTLEKKAGYWHDIKSSLSNDLRVELDFVEKNNTWKALLQLLHQEEFTNITEFTSYIQKLPAPELKFICLPYIGKEYQQLRKIAAIGEGKAIQSMQNLTESFFPDYIAFISKVDAMLLKKHLITVMNGWYTDVMDQDLDSLKKILEIDYEAKKQMEKKMTSEELVEWATGGISYIPEPSIHTVLLIPQYIYRPWNIEADIEGTKVFYYPVSNDSISPNDSYTPNNFTVLKFKALGDETRLRIVKMLFERNRSLQGITEQLNIGKSTIHHHLKILRAAKLVEIVESKYALKTNAIDSLGKELNSYLTK